MRERQGSRGDQVVRAELHSVAPRRATHQRDQQPAEPQPARVGHDQVVDVSPRVDVVPRERSRDRHHADERQPRDRAAIGERGGPKPVGDGGPAVAQRDQSFSAVQRVEAVPAAQRAARSAPLSGSGPAQLPSLPLSQRCRGGSDGLQGTAADSRTRPHRRPSGWLPARLGGRAEQRDGGMRDSSRPCGGSYRSAAAPADARCAASTCVSIQG